MTSPSLSIARRWTGWMLSSGDVVELDLGTPTGSEAGMVRPAVVVTAERVLAGEPHVIQVVPLIRARRGYASEVSIDADPDNGLEPDSAAQCQHIRAVATVRVSKRIGNVGPVGLGQIRETIATLLDL